MNHSCMSYGVFMKWFMLAMAHGLVIYYISLVFILLPESAMQHDGRDIGFWVSGHSVYGACVICANTVIFFKYNNHTGIGEGLIALMIFAFFLFLAVESELGWFP